ncbi:MAG TPA: hypothetical protein VF460_07150 [Burkholderiales bacterium]
MKLSRRILQQAALLLVAAGLYACASTTLDNSWRDPKYSGGPVTKVLVTGISNQASVRRAFEETFAQALTQAGVKAVTSHSLIPQDGQIEEDILKNAVEQAGADGVLITRMVGRQTDIAMTPTPVAPSAYGMRGHYTQFYATSWNGYYEPTVVQQFNYVLTETTLFRSDAPEPVWSGTARTLDPTDVRKATADFAKVVIAALKKEGLI